MDIDHWTLKLDTSRYGGEFNCTHFSYRFWHYKCFKVWELNLVLTILCLTRCGNSAVMTDVLSIVRLSTTCCLSNIDLEIPHLTSIRSLYLQEYIISNHIDMIIQSLIMRHRSQALLVDHNQLLSLLIISVLSCIRNFKSAYRVQTHPIARFDTYPTSNCKSWL